MAQPSQRPVRYPSGVTPDFPWQPLNQCGAGNPFFYHMWSDDFDQEISESGYTKTTTGNGTIALAPGDGGVGLFTTNSSTPAGGDICSIQLPAAGFSLTQGKKQFFLARIQLSSATNAAFLAGLIQTTATPFTVTDGVYFQKATGALNNLQLKTAVGGVISTFNIPTAAYTLANATYLDLGFAISRNQVVAAYVGSGLVGYGPAQFYANPGPALNVVVLGVGVFDNGNYWTPTGANLNPTLAIQSGTAASSTMTADFLMAAKER